MDGRVDRLVDEARGVDASAAATLVLAHGAGAAMDSRGMTDIATRLADRGIRVIRFEFAYMAARRDGVRKPPPRAETLVGEYRAVLDTVSAKVHGGAVGAGGGAGAGSGAGDAGAADAGAARVVIGGRSMGGRVASLIADDAGAAGANRGARVSVVPLPSAGETRADAHCAPRRPARPDADRAGHARPFGSPDEIAGYGMSGAVSTVFLEDGDHDLRPRKSVSGFTHEQHLDAAADAVAAFVRRVTGG